MAAAGILSPAATNKEPEREMLYLKRMPEVTRHAKWGFHPRRGCLSTERLAGRQQPHDPESKSVSGVCQSVSIYIHK